MKSIAAMGRRCIICWVAVAVQEKKMAMAKKNSSQWNQEHGDRGQGRRGR